MLGRRHRQMPGRTRLVAAILAVQTLCQLAEGLKVSVAIPELVKLNDAFWLNCSHHHGDSPEEIYAIKWYKDDEEFYRFLPKAEPQKSIYETNGVQLDVS